MLINAEGKVWVGQRLDSTLEAWQMPQGGLDEGEDPERARFASWRRRPGSAATRWRSSPATARSFITTSPTSWSASSGRAAGAASARPGSSPASSAPTPTSTSPLRTPSSEPGNGPIPEDLPAMIVPFKKKLYEDVLAAFRDWL